MVALSAGAGGELERLIEEQRRDARGGRGGRPRREVLACDVGRRGLDLDRLPRRPLKSIPLIEGRPCEWTAEATHAPCRVCGGEPGAAVCLKCNRSAYDASINWPGVEKWVGGPTVYGGTGGLKGGMGG